MMKQTLLESWNHRGDGIGAAEEKQHVKRQTENYDSEIAKAKTSILIMQSQC